MGLLCWLPLMFISVIFFDMWKTKNWQTLQDSLSSPDFFKKVNSDNHDPLKLQLLSFLLLIWLYFLISRYGFFAILHTMVLDYNNKGKSFCLLAFNKKYRGSFKIVALQQANENIFHCKKARNKYYLYDVQKKCLFINIYWQTKFTKSRDRQKK